jgi:hypothetical protein
MKPKSFVVILIALLFCLVSVLSYGQRRDSVKEASKRAVKDAPKAVPKQTLQAKAKPAGLPEQPKCDNPALPDITIEGFKFSGPAGPWQPSKQYGIGVVLKNIGQCESGVFLAKLQVRVQVPSENKNQLLAAGTKRVSSIQPRKTGVSPGTSEIWFNYTTGNYAWAQYTFTATTDYTNHIEEFDEANNSKTSIDQVADTYRR